MRRIFTQRYLPGLLVLLLAIGMATFGWLRGEVNVVYGKAVTVCLQCIGLG